MIILTIVLVATLGNAQTTEEVPRKFVRSGRYNPQLYGQLGTYIPDDRGKYIHIPVPYNGGYGDRGLKYNHEEDLRARYWHQDEQYRQQQGVWGQIPSYFSQDLDQSYAQDYQYDNEDGWRIIQFQWSKDGRTRYSYLYETESKILAEEVAKLAMLNDNSSALRVDGFFQYEGDDGTVYEVEYIANEHGFFPRGRHIHRSIQNVLDFLLKNTTNSRKK